LSIGLFSFLSGVNAEDGKSAAEEEKTVSMEDFEKQVEACKDAMDKENKFKYKTSILSALKSAKHNLINQRYRYVENDYVNIYNYSLPISIRNELEKLEKICNLLVKQGKAGLIEDGNALYQEVIDITEKDVSLDELEKLKDEVEIRRDRMNSASNTGAELKNTYKKLEIADRFLGYWIAYRSALEENNYQKASSQLDSMLSNPNYYSVLSSKVLKLKKAALTEMVISKFDSEVKVLREELIKADDSGKVKKVLYKFQVLSNNYSSILRDTPQQYELSYSQTALGYWLNVIAYEESGDFRNAISSLNNFNSGYYRNTMLLKWKDINTKKQELAEKMLSEAEARDSVIESIDEFIKNCKDLKSLISFRTKLQEMMNNYSGTKSQELYALQTDLQGLASLNKSYVSGNYPQIFQLMQYQQSQPHRWKELLDKYKEMLFLEALAAVADVDVKKLQDKEKKSGEIILEFADKAAENKEWGNVYMLLNAYTMAFCSSGIQPVWLREEITGCKSFMTGRNFEKAGMYQNAVASYIIVLQQKDSKRIPLKEAIERINAIRESNPTLFDPETGSLKTPPKPALQPAPVLNPSPYPIQQINGCRIEEIIDSNPKPGIRHKK